MYVAQIGPLTALAEATASAVGAGMVLGSVSVGIVSIWRGLRAGQAERLAVVGGYLGGAFGAGLAAVDLVFRSLSGLLF